MDQIDFNIKTIDFVKNIPEGHRKKILEAFNFNANEFDEFLMGKREINAFQFFNLAESFGFSLKAFQENKIDFDTIKKHQSGQINHLPKKYDTEGGVKNYIFHIILDYIELILGTAVKNNILKYLQLPTIYDLSRAMDMMAVDDFIHYLDSLGFTNDDYIKMGHFSVSRLLQSNNIESSMLPPKIEDRFGWFLKDIMPKFIENKNNYAITLVEKNRIEFAARPDPLYIDQFPEKPIGTKSICFMKIGGAKAIIDHHGPHKTEITHTECMYENSNECLYTMNFLDK